MRIFNKLRRKLAYLPESEIARIHQAYLFALKAHEGQKRATGEPYITHPVSVACILAGIRMDSDTIMAGLLHDVIEDNTEVTKAALERQFGEDVAEIVDGVSKLTQIKFPSKAEAQAEFLCKMVLAMAEDIRVIIVKLADRLHNMRTLGSLRPDKQRRIAKETLEIFAPIARRLGMYEFSVEMEDLAFRAHSPNRYKVLQEALSRARGNRKKVLLQINKAFNDAIEHSDLPTCVIAGREKHLYSIYRKMRNKHLSFSEVMDVYAFRIITQDVDTCYRALGLTHNLYKPVPERFKDYIALPKANGYQSLHTTLFGPYGLPIEVQIRTTEMDRLAVSGIAAHWLYKSSGLDQPHEAQIQAQKWAKNLLELRSQTSTPLEFVESMKRDLFTREVYVFTPKGKILELPNGATAIDFAYAVHTDIGNQCVAIKIDRQLAPLSTVLQSGQTLEVVTNASARPNPAWLDFVTTSKARSGIRHFLKNQRRSESIAFGRDMLSRVLAEHGLKLKADMKQHLLACANDLGLRSVDDLYEKIALGEQMPAIILERLRQVDDVSTIDQDDAAVRGPMLIKGTEGVAVKLATCCRPIPGDPIVGILQVGRGVEVHVDGCRKLHALRNHPEKLMLMRWAESINEEFPVSLNLHLIDERGALAQIASIISDVGSNIIDISVKQRDGQHFLVALTLLVKDRVHLARVVRLLRRIAAVAKITRKKG